MGRHDVPYVSYRVDRRGTRHSSSGLAYLYSGEACTVAKHLQGTSLAHAGDFHHP